MAENLDLPVTPGAALTRLVCDFDYLSALSRDGLLSEFGAPDSERLLWDSLVSTWGDFMAITDDGLVQSMTLGWREHPARSPLVSPTALRLVEELETWNKLLEAAADSGLPFDVVGWPEQSTPDSADPRTEHSRRIRFATGLSLVLTDGTVDYYWRRASSASAARAGCVRRSCEAERRRESGR